jgi:hypothetical protein
VPRRGLVWSWLLQFLRTRIWIAQVAHVPSCWPDGLTLCSHLGPSLFSWASGLHYSHEGILVPIQYGCTWRLIRQLLGFGSVYSNALATLSHI